MKTSEVRFLFCDILKRDQQKNKKIKIGTANLSFLIIFYNF